MARLVKSSIPIIKTMFISGTIKSKVLVLPQYIASDFLLGNICHSPEHKVS
jgi:hypothetical protein